MGDRLQAVMNAATEFMEIADVPAHLRNSELYAKRRETLKTVASMGFGQLLPDEDEEKQQKDLVDAAQKVLEFIEAAGWPLSSTEGVTMRGEFRDAVRILNARVGAARARMK
jgi:hypothetical protein